MIVVIYNFAANIGRELRTYFSRVYYGLPYQGFDQEHIAFKYSQDVQELIFAVRMSNAGNLGIRKKDLDSFLNYDTHGGLFPYENNSKNDSG